nr:immunoglobulin heavy chain junction region [Mus musculus]
SSRGGWLLPAMDYW